jgi:hypothetical protein
MTKTLITFLVICCSFSSLFGQSTNLILTEAQNNKWFDSLAAVPLSGQLQMIGQRLLADTNVFIRKSYNDRIKVVEQVGNRVEGFGKPTIVVENRAMWIDNKTDAKKIVGLTQLLTTDYIDDITLLKGTDPKTTALYGSSGMNGVILMKLKRKKDIKQFQKLKFTSNY